MAGNFRSADRSDGSLPQGTADHAVVVEYHLAVRGEPHVALQPVRANA